MTNDVLSQANAEQFVILPIASIAAIGFIAASLLATHSPLGVVALISAPGAVWLMRVLGGRLSLGKRRFPHPIFPPSTAWRPASSAAHAVAYTSWWTDP